MANAHVIQACLPFRMVLASQCSSDVPSPHPLQLSAPETSLATVGRAGDPRPDWVPPAMAPCHRR